MGRFLDDRGTWLAGGIVALPVAAVVSAVLVRQGGIALLPAAVVGVPLALFAIALLLPVSYTCRTLPLGTTLVTRLVTTHAAAAGITSLAWVYLGSGVARLSAPLFPRTDLPTLYARQVPALALTGGVLYLLGAAFHYVLLAEQAARQAEQRAMELKVLTREAELRALKAQVHPHFLFNSLNSISALTAHDPAKAREMCILLAEFFRKSLAMGERTAVPLEEEWALARTYLAIEGLRLGARLTVEEALETAVGPHSIPPLLLQPLVENAVRHGVATCAEGGVLRLSAARDGSTLRLGVSNPFDPEAPRRPGIGLGLTNVRQRLLAYYGDRARLQEARGERTFRVEIVIPIEEKKG
jgi:two-component system, LytTR family, sensor histidine kinase AlgZ